MTTVAANRHCMAADSKTTYGGSAFRSRKLERIGEAIVGCAGSTDAIGKFMGWLRSARAAPKDEIPDPPKFGKDEEWDALLLTPAGLFLYPGSCEPVEIDEPHYAIGSGAYAALLAMRKYGRDPEGAIEDAGIVDDATSGPVLVLTLEDHADA